MVRRRSAALLDAMEIDAKSSANNNKQSMLARTSDTTDTPSTTNYDDNVCVARHDDDNDDDDEHSSKQYNRHQRHRRDQHEATSLWADDDDIDDDDDDDNGFGRRRRRRRSLSAWSSMEDEDGSASNSGAGPGFWHAESVRRHLLLPHLMSGYLQLGFNVSMIVFIMYTLASFVNNVHYDIDNRVSEYSSEILNDMAQCSKNYADNRCGTREEVPVLRATCAMWERCMTRDPHTVGRTKLSAKTLGEILNSFVEPLSYKTMGFFTLFLFGFMIASNIAFKLGSSKPGVLVSEAIHSPHRVSNMISAPTAVTNRSGGGAPVTRTRRLSAPYRRISPVSNSTSDSVTSNSKTPLSAAKHTRY